MLTLLIHCRLICYSFDTIDNDENDIKWKCCEVMSWWGLEIEFIKYLQKLLSLFNMNLVDVVRWGVWQFFFFCAWHRGFAGEFSQKFVGKFLMAMRDRHVFVLLVITRYRVLETFWAQALFQLRRCCQVNFIASDTFFSWISFKGEKKWEKEFLVCCTRNENMGNGHKKRPSNEI